MTLTSHIVVASALATILPSNPALGFVFGFASHYVLDSITHWDYDLGSIADNKVNPLQARLVINKAIIFDVLKVVLDIILGFVIALFLITRPSESIAFKTVIAAGLGAVMPDFLQFLYFKWKYEPLTTLQRIHNFFHSKDDLKHVPFVGIMEQVSIVVLISMFL